MFPWQLLGCGIVFFFNISPWHLLWWWVPGIPVAIFLWSLAAKRELREKLGEAAPADREGQAKPSMSTLSDTPWQTYSDPRDGFRAELPGAVTRQFHSLIGSDDGRSPSTVVYVCKGRIGRPVYQVSITRLMFDVAATPLEFLETAVSELVGTVHGAVLVAAEPSQFLGLPAMAFSASVNSSAACTLTGVAVLRGRALYNLSVLYSMRSQGTNSRGYVMAFGLSSRLQAERCSYHAG